MFVMCEGFITLSSFFDSRLKRLSDCLDPTKKASASVSGIFLFFFFFFWCTDKVTVHTLFMVLTTTLFRKKNIKNEFHSTIHTFKNYFAIVFSVFNKISCIQTDPKTPWTVHQGIWTVKKRVNSNFSPI